MANSERIQAGTGARRPGVGAVAAGPRRRKRGLWWLLAALVALALIALLIVLLSDSDASKPRHVASTPTAAAPASSTVAAPTTAALAATTPAATSSSGAPAGAGPGSAALVGGGGVAAEAATGALAASGSIGAVLFVEARTRLDSNAKAVIATAVEDVKARHAHAVTVVGYTDTIGNQAANRTLSLKRARKVAAAMRRQLKDPSVSFRTEARGQTHPVAPNSTPSGRQLDRRVAISIAH